MRPYAYLPLLLLAIVALAIGPALAAADDEDHAAGQRLFRGHCSKCHGLEGEGGEGPRLASVTLLHAATPEMLGEIIAWGIPNTAMPGSSLNQKEIQEVIRFLDHLRQVPVEPVPGDPKRGEKLYANADCATCHAIKGKGGTMGPELSKIGLRRGAAHLRKSLVEPEADIPKSFIVLRSDISIVENFLELKVVTKTGKTIYGVRVNEDTFSIQLRDADNQLFSFFKSELAEIDKHWGKSPMSSYRDVYSKDELDDMVAYLVSLKGE